MYRLVSILCKLWYSQCHSKEMLSSDFAITVKAAFLHLFSYFRMQWSWIGV